MKNQILHGDALSMLKTLPDACVQTCVTSPPYYGLRDYGVEGQIGLEESPAVYIAKLVEVFREVRRVLRADGTAWVNLGDSYASQGMSGLNIDKQGKPSCQKMGALLPSSRVREKILHPGFKQKDLMMMPARVAIALCDDGWWLRSDIIWHKVTAMPESVEDRPTSAHEHVFLLSKSERYYYDAVAVREPGTEWRGQAGTFARSGGKSTLVEVPGQSYASHRASRDDRVPVGRNARNVWSLVSQPYPGAHFAVMPEKLVEPCILAGSSPKACEHCGAPWEQITETSSGTWEMRKAAGVPLRYGLQGSKGTSKHNMGHAIFQSKGFQPTCTCPDNTGSGRCVILDPFLGSGTVASVANRLGRYYLGIELNAAYIEMARRRVAQQPLDLDWSC